MENTRPKRPVIKMAKLRVIQGTRRDDLKFPFKLLVRTHRFDLVGV
jgi:hypothetical protein